jgi:hypothetical protein
MEIERKKVTKILREKEVQVGDICIKKRFEQGI